MLKAELEKENKELRQKYDTLIENIHKATKDIVNNTCEDSIPHIETFYKQIGIPLPNKKIQIIVEIPYYVDHKSLYVFSDDEDEFTITTLNEI